MNTKSIIAALIPVVAISACMPYRTPEFFPPDNQFPGLASEQAVDVVAIHGMCTHTSNWVLESWHQMGESLGMTYAEPSAPWWEMDEVEVWRTRLEGTSQPISITAYAVVWSGLTTPLKTSLCYDASRDTEMCSKSATAPDRALLNSTLKTNLVNDCLSDAVLYMGTFGETIRNGMANALKAIGEDRQGNADNLFLITESLGSKILADVLTESGDQENLVAAVENPRAVYMAANQIPLLDLSTPPGQPGVEEAIAPLSTLEQLRLRLGGDLVGAMAREIPFVLFSDPNDLLTYEFDRADLGSDTTNVRINIAPTYFWLFANPMRAHTGYLENEKVWQQISCGKPTRCN